MATTNEKEVLIETLKTTGTTRSFTWMDWRNKKNAELAHFKEILTPDWDSNSEKVFKKREEEHKKMLSLVDEFVKFKFPDEKNTYISDYEVTVMITKLN
jgi:hypothetical protein